MVILNKIISPKHLFIICREEGNIILENSDVYWRILMCTADSMLTALNLNLIKLCPELS